MSFLNFDFASFNMLELFNSVFILFFDVVFVFVLTLLIYDFCLFRGADFSELHQARPAQQAQEARRPIGLLGGLGRAPGHLQPPEPSGCREAQ